MQHREKVFQAVHGLAHPGTRASRRLISARFVWRSCAKDITAWCKDCVGCARAKVHVHYKAAVEKIEVPAHRFMHVHVDLVGPLPVAADRLHVCDDCD
jgi:cleavage and polyadenylation specificity factor subunit 1